MGTGLGPAEGISAGGIHTSSCSGTWSLFEPILDMCACAGGDATFQQVEVDMLRMAALFVVERLKPWLMTYLASLLAASAPAHRPSPGPR